MQSPIQIQTYAGPSSLQIVQPGLTVWLSYNTPVAFLEHGGKRVVSQNNWGPTTGKHLNAIDGGDKPSRVPHTELMEALRGYYAEAQAAASWAKARQA